MRAAPFAALLLGAALAPVAARAQGLASQKVLGVEQAAQAVLAAMQAWHAQGYLVSAAVVDQGGVLRAFVRDDGAGPHTVTSAQRKAFTSASLKQPTQVFVEALEKNPANAGIRNLDDRVLILAGGLPIKVGNEVIGGIGVGGAPGGEKDAACAQKGLDKIADALH
jgi:uncharacterized protein GlcG (DUF336 family)